MSYFLKFMLIAAAAACGFMLEGCAPPQKPEPIIPARIYAEQVKRQVAQDQANDARARAGGAVFSVPQVRFASDELPPEVSNNVPSEVEAPVAAAVAGKDGNNGGSEPQFYKFDSTMKNRREYTGPLPLGDPGTTASLWRESRGNSDLFHDDRAWQPMDLITIVVQERSEGNDEAKTEIKQKSTVLASIENFLGFESDVKTSNPSIDLAALIKGDTQNDFKGEGKTNRKDSLTAKLSAMVAEVLPSGVLRIEGQKIISVNSEEKVMVISGIVRPKDVNSANEIDSSKIANMRIDYYGKGIVGEAQHGGWGGRLMRDIWPF